MSSKSTKTAIALGAVAYLYAKKGAQKIKSGLKELREIEEQELNNEAEEADNEEEEN